MPYEVTPAPVIAAGNSVVGSQDHIDGIPWFTSMLLFKQRYRRFSQGRQASVTIPQRARRTREILCHALRLLLRYHCTRN